MLIGKNVFMGDPAAAADGFDLFVNRSAFTAPWEPIYQRVDDHAMELGVLLDQRHCNSRGTAHGGLITTLADNAMGRAGERALHPDRQPDVATAVTVHIDVDFLRPAGLGQWLVARATLTKPGRTLHFAECVVSADAVQVARAHAWYRTIGTGGS